MTSIREHIPSAPERKKGAEQDNAVAASPADWIPGQDLLDDFVVERVLGEGGMGKVYLVKSQTTNMRFAVKRAKGLKESDRRNFLAELQTWIDLPEHPNLVSCRFFRTVGDEVLIFAEYIEGGSLKEWISSRKLYAGGVDKALERVLDTAIQFAWGLHCLHELGLVHQDVKPANVMIENDVQVAVQGMRVRVTDYGLARARVTDGERLGPVLGQSIVVSSGGYTPAYCSPEQAGGQKLDRRTDVWSWGISVLEMFQGQVVWQSGTVAARALEAFLEHNGEEVGIPALPVEVANLLKGCFCEDPAQRWQSLEVVVQELRSAYQAAVGAEYSRALVKIVQKSITPQVEISERRAFGGSWTNPREWLERALRAEGRDPAEAVGIMARCGSSRRGQLVADLAAYDEVRRMYERLIKGGRKDLENELASVCHEAAFVHATADDSSGALALFDRAIDILGQLVNVEGRRELATGLANLYQNKADMVGRLGDNRAAVDLLDRAIEILGHLSNIEDRREFSKCLAILAKLYVSKADVVGRLGDNRAAVTLYDRAIEIHKLFEERRESGDILATAYMNKANAVRNLGDSRSALVLFDQAIKIYERLVNVEGRRELARDLAIGYMNKANAVRDLGDNQAAMGLCDHGIVLLERLVNVEGLRELANDLATFYTSKAITVGILGDNRAAVDLLDQAIAILERLVNVEGRRDLSNDLAMLYMNKANAINNLGGYRAAVDLLDRTIAIRERLVNVEGRSDLADKLAMVYLSKAHTVGRMGDLQTEVTLYDRAIEIYERLVNVEGHNELADRLAKIYENKAIAVGRMGEKQAPLALFDQAIKILDRLVKVEGRRELVGDLARVKAIHGGGLVVLGDTEGATERFARPWSCCVRKSTEPTRQT